MEIIQRSKKLFNPTTSIDEDDISDWLLFEILIRLPLKSVHQCRVVSKRWLCVASDPYFVRAYASRASSASSPWIVLSHYIYAEENFPPAFVHNPSHSNVIPRELYAPSSTTTIGPLYIVGASDGLLLYCYTSRARDSYLFDFCMCNPITRRRAQPVALRVPYDLDHGWGFLTRVGLTLKTYLIVNARPKHDLHAIALNVYSSEVGDWEEFTVAGPKTCPFRLQESAAVVDGILYWAGVRGDVIAYDPEASPPERQVRFIREPHRSERVYNTYFTPICMEFRGKLRYFGGYTRDRHGIPMFKTWKLKDSGEWSLVHKVKSGGAVGKRNHGILLDVLCFDPINYDVVYLLDKKGPYVFSFNMKSGTLDDYQDMIVDKGFRTCVLPWIYVLVVPPWPTHVAEEHLERRRPS